MIGSIVLLIVLIFLNAVFASAEIAVISMNDTRLKKLVEDGNRKAIRLAALTEQPARFLATIQVAITMSGFLSSAVAADNFSGPLVDLLVKNGFPVPVTILKPVIIFVITLVLGYFNLVFGELVPKRIAMKRSEQLAMKQAGMLYAVSKIFAPLVSLLTISTNLVLRGLGLNPDSDEEKLSEEEIRMMLSEGNQQGIIDEHENEIIQNVFEFDDTSVEQICTHRMDVVGLNDEDSMEIWEEIIIHNRHTFYPVYHETQDQVIGILDTRDYFRLQKKNREDIMHRAVKEAYFIPEEMKADTLLNNMKRRREYFAVLIDEYGGMTGIITIRDLLEELVGELYDEGEEEKQKEITLIGDHMWSIPGDAELEDVEKSLGVSLPLELCDTFNGLIYHLLGEIPEDGRTFSCQGYGLCIEVKKVKNHRVENSLVSLCGEVQKPE